MERKYPVKYTVKKGSFTPPKGGRRPTKGIRVIAGNTGYTDTLLLVSVINEGGGATAVVVSTEKPDSDGSPPTKLLTLARRVIEDILFDRPFSEMRDGDNC